MNNQTRFKPVDKRSQRLGALSSTHSETHFWQRVLPLLFVLSPPICFLCARSPPGQRTLWTELKRDVIRKFCFAFKVTSLQFLPIFLQKLSSENIVLQQINNMTTWICLGSKFETTCHGKGHVRLLFIYFRFSLVFRRLCCVKFWNLFSVDFKTDGRTIISDQKLTRRSFRSYNRAFKI